MDKEKIILVSLVVFVLVAFGSVLAFNLKAGSTDKPVSEKQVEPLQQYKSIITGTTGSGDVEIELQPHLVENGALKVDLSANTHSVDLSIYDLLEIATLEYGSNSVLPSKAPELGGHHVSGTLVFEVDEPLSAFTIRIKNIPKTQDRVFTWG